MIDVDRAGNVLYLLFAPILKPEIELIAHLVADHATDTNTAGLGQAFEPRCDVDPIAEDVLFLRDNVAEIDTDAELDPLIG